MKQVKIKRKAAKQLQSSHIPSPRFEITQQMRSQLEQNILNNVEVNFLFNQGNKLTNGLIDPDRLFVVMNKVKSMVTSSKIISYQEICDYIESEGKHFTGDS